MLGVLVWDGVSFLSLLLLVSVRSLSSVGLRLLGLYVDCSWEGCIIEELQQYGAVWEWRLVEGLGDGTIE